MTIDELKALAIEAAKSHDIEPALFLALVHNESSWNPDAVRLEQGFYSKYVSTMKGLSITEKILRAASFGLCQIMGQVARELGFDDPDLSKCAEPRSNLILGCKRLRTALQRNNFVTKDALLDYNGGGDLAYPDRVLRYYDQYKAVNQ
jgi:soluble lytic murein transglycosylase-like protein